MCTFKGLVISWVWVIPLCIFLSKTFPDLHWSLYWTIGALGYLLTSAIVDEK